MPPARIMHTMDASITRMTRTLPAVDIRPLPFLIAPGVRAGRKPWPRGMASGASQSPQLNIHAGRRGCQGVAAGSRCRATDLTALRPAPYNRGIRPRRPRCGRETWPGMRPTYPVAEVLGDGIGPELSRAVHRLAEALP